MQKEEQEKIDEIRDEMKHGDEKLLQKKHKLIRLQNKEKYMRRKSDPAYAARTKRLINKGGVFEHFYPNTKDMTEAEFYQLVEYLNDIPEVRAHIGVQISRVFSERRTE